MANAVPDSRMPRRLIDVSSTIAVTANSTLCCATNGTAEPMLDIADAIDTATVKHVVDQQRTGHREAGGGAQVGGHHLVVAASGGIGVHVLPVGGDDDEHDERDGHTDPGRHRVSGQAGHGEHQEDLFRRVGDRRHGIGGEHRQRYALGQQCVGQPVAAERLPDEHRRNPVESLDTSAKGKPCGKSFGSVPVLHGPPLGRLTNPERTSGAGTGDGVRPRRRLAGRGLSRLGHQVAIIDRDPNAFTGSTRSSPVNGCRAWASTGMCCCARELGRPTPSPRCPPETTPTSSPRGWPGRCSVQRVVARIYDAKRAAVYERLGIPTVATVPWTTDRLLNALTHEAETARWRDPQVPSPSPRRRCTNPGWACVSQTSRTRPGARVASSSGSGTGAARAQDRHRWRPGVPRGGVRDAAEALAIAPQPPAEGVGE